MDPSGKKLASLRRWLSAISDPESLEAPQRKFVGHRDILVQSRARYEFVAPYLFGSVLDVGCGRGYGFEIIAPRTDMQLGIDISTSFLSEARLQFSGILFARGSGDALPLADHSFDSVLAFEVIEHAEDGLLLLKELRRVARKNSFIAVSTPNRRVSSGESLTPLNRFHHREYEADEFYQLLKRVFPSVQLFGQHERVDTNSPRSKLIDHIPIRLKYCVPPLVQTLLSVALRPPLRLEECRFQTTHLERAQTLLALCRLL